MTGKVGILDSRLTMALSKYGYSTPVAIVVYEEGSYTYVKSNQT